MSQNDEKKTTGSVNSELTAAEIRQQFLDFFQSKEHAIVPSAPIVLKDDPSLLFTNAGMNQFKDYFLGNKPAPFKRAADTQKCLRVSGKHNDLEEVGVDTYHHTMFEMLGNWSFGDYFKKEAIAWSWELLTEVYKLDKDKLYVTIFEGDSKEGLPKDEEAFNEWKKFVPEERILLGNKKDNFWEMGETGPCGPCTEIHVDCRSAEERKEVEGSKLVNNDHPQVIEIWNNVFIQFNRKKDGSLEPLPAQHVDTGMGFERLVRVLQGKTSNYDTDIFTGTINSIEKITGKVYDPMLTPADSSKAASGKNAIGSGWEGAVAFRVLADHIRAISFAIADGQLPSNTGAGYVIRRILRRAVRYYYSYLDYKQPLLFQLIPLLAKQFEKVFPELIQQLDFVSKVIKEEEEAFLRTLDKGLKRMDETIQQSQSTRVIEGAIAFELYDTFGFPLDLTMLIASENNLKVDEPGFQKEMQQQKNRSRSAAVLDTEDWITLVENASNQFLGYDSLEVETSVIKYRKVSSKSKEFYQLILGATPFYAESGGQIGDVGTLHFGQETIEVTNTKKENDLIIHFTDQLPSSINGSLVAKVNAARRQSISVHHSVTHLMHAALRNTLGKHVAQKGSLVNDEQLRFDFSHFAKVTDEEIAAVEKIVNEKIRENVPVVIRSMHKDEAIALGAMALFGEKYGDTVRVVIMDPQYSIELCGGTHVGYTGELGIFKIKHEAAVAAGVRRIEAVCGYAAAQYIHETFSELNAIRTFLKNPANIQKYIENLSSENSSLSKKLEGLEAKQLVGIRNELLQKSELINNMSFIGEIIEISSADALKKLCVDCKNQLQDHVVVLCANIDGKAFVALGISESVIASKKLDAAKLIREQVAGLIQGGGGGQATIATAGGQNISNLLKVIETIKSLL
ncbi:MAG: alanine--tRNA ligase [Chitinophagaceae bacterium]|nr:MAG: alanine--tRNA ligase [Chitinophagaceae bacterium]